MGGFEEVVGEGGAEGCEEGHFAGGGLVGGKMESCIRAMRCWLLGVFGCGFA